MREEPPILRSTINHSITNRTDVFISKTNAYMSCEILAVFPRTPNSLIHQHKPITNDIGFESMAKLDWPFYM